MTHSDSGSTQVTLVVTQAKTISPHPAPPPPSHLAFTGFQVAAAVLIAILLLSVGSFLVLVGRRVRPTRALRSA